MVRRKKRALEYRALRARERSFIDRSAALGYNQKKTLQAIRKFRRAQGLRIDKRQVYSRYTKALKTKRVHSARRTNRNTLKLYSKKARQQRFQKYMDKAEKSMSMIDLESAPESP